MAGWRAGKLLLVIQLRCHLWLNYVQLDEFLYRLR